MDYELGDVPRLAVLAAIVVFSVWWCALGLRGTLRFARHWLTARPWPRTALWLLLFGWNVLVGIVIVMVVMGAFTMVAANNLAPTRREPSA